MLDNSIQHVKWQEMLKMKKPESWKFILKAFVLHCVLDAVIKIHGFWVRYTQMSYKSKPKLALIYIIPIAVEITVKIATKDQ